MSFNTRRRFLAFGWNITEPVVIPVGCVTTPVTRMFLVCGKIWCICHNIIKTLDIHTLKIEVSWRVYLVEQRH